jgi:hypothetical protein
LLPESSEWISLGGVAGLPAPSSNADFSGVDAPWKTETRLLLLSLTFKSLARLKVDTTPGFSGPCESVLPLFNKSPKDLSGPAKEPKALPPDPLYALNPPLVDGVEDLSDIGDGEANGDLALPIAETEPNEGFGLPNVGGAPNFGVVGPGVADPDFGVDANTDTGLF